MYTSPLKLTWKECISDWHANVSSVGGVSQLQVRYGTTDVVGSPSWVLQSTVDGSFKSLRKMLCTVSALPIHPPTAPTQLSPAPLLAPLAGAPVTRAVPANDEVLEDDSSEEEDVPVVDDHQVPRNDERWRKIVEVLRPITQLLVRSAFETVHELSFLHGTLWRHSNCYM